MKTSKTFLVLVVLIGLLAAFAASMGLFYQTPGQPYALTTFRGEQTTINGSGLYRYDTVSSASQMRGNDVVTLALGLPLLVVSTGLARRGSLRGRLLLTGTLGFFLYTYMSMCFETAYNPLFLVYVALFALSLYAFILSLMTFDLAALPQQFSPRMPRRGIAVVLFAAGAFLTLAWLGRIAPTLTQNQTPPLENGLTLVIQAMDLALIVPLSFLSGVLLLRRSAWGYLLASVAVMKFLTMGTAVSLMALNMAVAGVQADPIFLVVFPALTLTNLLMAVLLLKSIQPEASPQSSQRPQKVQISTP